MFLTTIFPIKSKGGLNSVHYYRKLFKSGFLLSRYSILWVVCSQVDCLPVSCPYQMVMTERGCVESDADIKLTHFAVHVGLSPTSKTVPNFNEMTHLQKQQPFTWMKTPCSKIGWTDVGMYSTNKTDVHYARFKDYLLVRLEYYNSRALSLKNVRRVIDLCLKETWTLHIGEHVHIYDAEIFPYIRIDKFRPLRYIGIYGYYRIQLDTIFFMMKGHVMSAHIGRGPFELSKLYFCYMVGIQLVMYIHQLYFATMCLIVRVNLAI